MYINTNYNHQENSPNIIEESEQKVILLDEQQIVDILLNNQSHTLDDSIQLYELVICREIKGYLVDRSLLAIYNLVKKLRDEEEASKIIKHLLISFNICKLQSELCPELCQFNINASQLYQLNYLIEQDIINIIISERSEYFLNRYELEAYHIAQNITVVSPTNFLDWYDMEDKPKSLNDYIKSKNSSMSLVNFVSGKDYTSQILESLEKKLETNDDNLRDDKIILADCFLENFEVYCSKNHYASAKVTLLNQKTFQQLTKEAKGNGAVDALCRAFDSAIKLLSSISFYSYKSIDLYNIDEGLDSRVSATVIISSKQKLYEGKAIHMDSIKAAFFAYLDAVNNMEQNIPIYSEKVVKTVVAVVTQYKNGERCFKGINLNEKIISKVVLSDIDLSHANLNSAYMVKSELCNANLYEAKLDGITIIDTDLSNANLFCANISNATVQKSNLQGTKLNKAKLNQAALVEVDLKNAVLDNAQLEKANLSLSDLTEANLHEATLIEVIFSQTLLMRADLTGADLTGADLTGADLTGADLTGADLTGADLSRANLTNANLSDADLTGADLSRANLTNANLSDADLTDADLTDAHLANLNLSKTKLENSNLSNANLSKTNLEGVNLSKTILCRTFLNGAKMPNGEIFKGITSTEFEMREPPYSIPLT